LIDWRWLARTQWRGHQCIGIRAFIVVLDGVGIGVGGGVGVFSGLVGIVLGAGVGGFIV